jgi:signal transduction histidine kinase
MDVELMENVMCNLMDNAIKYTGSESIIHVSCKYENDMVEISVRDNGIGMSEEDLKRVFDLFERGSADEKNIFPGFGIGLHFVRLVVKGHGGKIAVKSRIEMGTEFTIKFIS